MGENTTEEKKKKYWNYKLGVNKMIKTIKMEFQPMILHVEGALKILDENGHLAKLDIITLKYRKIRI